MRITAGELMAALSRVPPETLVGFTANYDDGAKLGEGLPLDLVIHGDEGTGRRSGQQAELRSYLLGFTMPPPATGGWPVRVG